MLHRDVSVNNILIVDEPVEGGFHGFLHDFDCSYMEELESTDDPVTQSSSCDGDTEDELKERTVSLSCIADVPQDADGIAMPRALTCSWPLRL